MGKDHTSLHTADLDYVIRGAVLSVIMMTMQISLKNIFKRSNMKYNLYYQVELRNCTCICILYSHSGANLIRTVPSPNRIISGFDCAMVIRPSRHTNRCRTETGARGWSV